MLSIFQIFGTEGGGGENPNSLTYGHKTVTSAGTAEALVGASNVLKDGFQVVIKALVGNTGLIYVGDSSVDNTNGFELNPGDSVGLYVSDLDLIYIDSAVNGEGVSYIVEG